MRKGVPSGTSFAVSFARGVGIDQRTVDPLARELLPFWLGWLTAAPTKLGAAAPLLRYAMRLSSFGLIDYAVLRTQTIDDCLTEARTGGIDQFVILGAGLDARAWRMSGLTGATVFEVDHPATQRYKQARVSEKAPLAKVRFAPVDFERERVADALVESGFRSSSPTAWVWEGVAMYLERNAVLDTLSQATALSAPGSLLAMTYRTPGTLPFGPLGRATIPAMFRAAGEPLKATFGSGELADILAPAWEVSFDESPRGWKRRTGSRAEVPRGSLGERLAIARRT